MEARRAAEPRSVHGEGPCWDASSGSLFWVDIYGCKLHRLTPSTGETVEYRFQQNVCAVYPHAAGGLLLTLRNGFYRFDPLRGGEPEPIAVLDLPPGIRFNDGKCDRRGRCWAGTMVEEGEAGQAALYRLDPDGTLHEMLRGVTISNGIAWSEDESRMYYIDTHTRSVDAFDFDAAEGEISNRSRIVEFEDEEGWPDGMAIDREGYLWIAHWDGARVTRRHPKDGRVVGIVRLPVPKATSCAFGGEAGNTLYITTSAIDAEDDRCGLLYSVSAPASGRPAAAFGSVSMDF
ncbi:MAG TPA: SMP-30/gluconolactonase/LRE family protein [Paenibacillus sp.]|nr:SMP-30/gluconolactonase/LRE family protein [Paenibacillus sp.]